jgi:hypothetical protein
VGRPAGEHDAGVRFVDRATEAGLTRPSLCGDPRKEHLVEVNGSGVAVADYDVDGDLDLYVGTSQTRREWAAGEASAANALYRNNGDGTFTDVAAEAGVALRAWSIGVYFVDYDNDGDRDLFVTTWGPNVLFRNEGDGTFTDVSDRAGIAGNSAWSHGAAFGDFDADGDLDLYVTDYCEFDLSNPPLDGARTVWMGLRVLPGPQGLVGDADHLYRNNGDGTFTDVSDTSGIRDVPPAYGLGVVLSDLDRDGDLDIYVANDAVTNFLWRNDGGGQFSEVGTFSGVATNENAREQSGMGTDAADYDRDGLFDLLVTNFSHDFNTLYRNRGELVFTDATFDAGFKDSYIKLAWGAKFFDYDNDGWLDILVAGGHIYPEVDQAPHLNTGYRQPNTLYRNLGGGRFADVSGAAGPGLASVESSRGLAVADIDRDGDVDVVLTNLDAPPNLLINEGEGRGAWLAVRLVGSRSNRDAIGALIELEAGGTRWVREVNPFGSYLSQSDYDVHFGLGDVTTVDRLDVRWPSGITDTLTGVEVRQLITIHEGRGAAGA